MQNIAISRRLILGLSGAAKIIQAHINHFTSKRIEIDIYHQKSKDMRYNRNVKTIKVQNIFSKNNDYTFATNIKKKISNKKYDLKIGHGDDWSSDLVFIHNLNARLQEELFDKPKTHLNPNDQVQKELLENHRFNHIIANSELVKKDLVSRYKITNEEITVIYPGYDESIFNVHRKKQLKPTALKNHGVPISAFKIGFYTSGGFNKRGIDIFIDTIKLLPGHILNEAFIIVVGKTEDKSAINQTLKSIGLKENQFKIFNPIQDVLSLLCLADIIVHPAYFEEFGMIVQEAMAIGIPVISSNNVGAMEINPNQIITLPNKPNAQIFAEQLSDLYQDSFKYNQLSDISAEKTKNNTFSNHLKKLDEVILKLTNQ